MLFEVPILIKIRPKTVPFVISIIFSEHCQARDQSYGAQIAKKCIKLGYSYTYLACALSGSSCRAYLLSLSLLLKVFGVVKKLFNVKRFYPELFSSDSTTFTGAAFYLFFEVIY